MKKLKQFFSKKNLSEILIKILEARTSLKVLGLVIFIAIIYVLINVSFWIDSSKLKSVSISDYQESSLELKEGELMEIGSEEVAIHTSGNYELFINTLNTNLKVRDNNSGKVWNTTIENDNTLLGTEANLSKANIVIEYESLARSVERLNTYEHSVLSKDYSIEKIENGVRINYSLSKSEITLSYFPVQISAERMETKIYSNSSLTERDLNIINRVYSLSSNKEYYLRSASAQTNVRKELYRIFYEVCGYTDIDLIMDNEMYGYETTVQAIPRFSISIELILFDNRLLLNIPTFAIESAENYRITNILILPYFGAASNLDEGYLFVPDGSGALINYNSFQNSDYVYLKQIYDNDLLFNSGFSKNNSYSTEISLPVFGSINSQKNQGLMGVVSQGEELSKIYSYSSGYMNYKYNCVMPTFCHNIYDDIGVYDFYDNNKVRIYAQNPVHFNYQVDYFFLTNENNNYFGMAKTYQQYLIDKYDLEKKYNEDPSVVLEILGGVTIDSNIAGIPVKKEITLTSFKEALTILDGLANNNLDNLKVVYAGWFNRGINQSIGTKIDVLASLEKDMSFKEFNETIKSKGYDISFAANVLKLFNDKENGFKNSSHGVKLMDNDSYPFYSYSLTTNRMEKNDYAIYYLSPKYALNISKRIDDFFQTNDLNKITLNDLGNLFMADYNRKQFIDPLTSRRMIIDALQTFEERQSLTLRNPFPYALPYADYLVDISYESSNYYTFSATVPFVQLVYNGLVNYSSNYFNNGTIDFNRISYMKALETGADLSYLITYHDTNLLKETAYNFYYSANFHNWEDDILEYKQKYQDDLTKIESRIIVNHQVLSENVYLVTYQTGVQCIYNYSDRNFVFEGIEVGRLDYTIIEEGI